MINFDISKLMSTASSMNSILNAASSDLGNFDLTKLLPEKHRDIPKMVNDIKSQLDVKIMNRNRSLVLYNNVEKGKTASLLDVSEYIVDVISSMLDLTDKYYHLIVDIENESRGHTRMVKEGQFGLALSKLEIIGNSMLSELERRMTATTGRNYTIEIPALMYAWEANIINRVYEEVLNENRVARCRQRMESMMKMLADQPNMLNIAVNQLSGERFLSSSTGTYSQLWNLPNMVPFLTKTALSFSPRIEMIDIDSASDRIILNIQNTRTTIASSFMSLNADSNVLDDISKVIAAMLYPGQILIDVMTDSPTANDRVGALFSKLFLSTSTLCGNLSLNTAAILDGMIRKLLVTELNYSEDNPPDGLNVLKNNARSNLWAALSTSVANPGDGWINHGLGGVNIIPDFGHPYVSAVSLPQYGNVPRNSDLNLDNGFDIGTPEIYDSLIAAITESAAAGLNLKKIMSLRRDAYVTFLSNINDFIYKYTYNSFKAPEAILLDMRDNEGNSSNDPIVFTVRPSTFLAMWKFMPKAIIPSTSYLSIGMIESKIESEMSLFKAVHDMVGAFVHRQDLGANLRTKHKLRIAQKICKSPFIDAVCKLSLREPYSERIPANIDVGNIRDSPYATVLNLVMNDCLASPERIGYTSSMVWREDKISTFTGTLDDLEDITTLLNKNRKTDWRIIQRLSLQEVIQLGNNGSFITDVLLSNNDAEITRLKGFSFFVPYSVQVSTEYERVDNGVQVVKSDGKGNTARERITFDAVVDNYTVPELDTKVYRDAHVLERPYRNVWYIGESAVVNVTETGAFNFVQILRGFSGIKVSTAIRDLSRPREIYAPSFTD
jgi:hypothetical protein